jgi:amino acid transporter
MTNDARRPPRRQKHEYPNFPEVSGTTLPLLATVLAGFAVTIIIQLVLSPEGADSLPVLTEVALAAFLLALLAFLSATAFAVNAQANNYLPFTDLSDTTRQFMQIDDPDTWLQRVERRWHVYHLATLIAFYSGVILLLGGVNLILWEYAGTLIAALFLWTALASLAVNMIVSRIAKRHESRPPR